jgi:hypothetical protein
MIRNVLQAISGIEIYPVISLLIFFTLFISVLIWFFRADKNHLHRMGAIPLDENVPVLGKEQV